jgi:neutral ceramidase
MENFPYLILGGNIMSQLLSGIARANITPPVGMLMSGYGARKTPAVGIHDDLYAVALYLNDGTTEASLITMDLIDTDSNGTNKIRKACANMSGVPSKNIMVACSHTHGGPQTGVYGDDEGDYLKKSYTDSVIYKIAGALSEAKKNAVPVSVGHARQDCHIASNRRERRADGVVILGYNPDGPIDPFTDVIRFDRLDRKEPMAIIFSYASHGTTMGGENYLYTADYIGFAKRMVEQIIPTALTSFVAGCSGDVNPYPRGTFELCERHGKRLGCSASQATLDIFDMVEDARIAVAQHKFKFKLENPPSLDEARVRYKKAKENADREIEIAKEKSGGKPVDEKMVLPWHISMELRNSKALVAVLEKGDPDLTIPLETQAISIGDCAIVGMPGEIFVKIGQTVAERSPFARTIHVSHANGSAGYVPTADQIPLGGYEVELARASRYGLPIVSESDNTLIESALTSLKRCYKTINS